MARELMMMLPGMDKPARAPAEMWIMAIVMSMAPEERTNVMRNLDRLREQARRVPAIGRPNGSPLILPPGRG